MCSAQHTGFLASQQAPGADASSLLSRLGPDIWCVAGRAAREREP
jgi:hypothetical protein